MVQVILSENLTVPPAPPVVTPTRVGVIGHVTGGTTSTALPANTPTLLSRAQWDAIASTGGPGHDAVEAVFATGYGGSVVVCRAADDTYASIRTAITGMRTPRGLRPELIVCPTWTMNYTGNAKGGAPTIHD